MQDKTTTPLAARACYGHLGGTLGNRLFERLVELDWFRRVPEHSTTFEITTKGKRELAKLGVNVYSKR